MTKPLAGLRDKLYWRPVHGRWHCFKKLSEEAADLWNVPRRETRWGSLCGGHMISRTDGQAIERPHVELRCGLCDGREMDRRGWDESGPATV